MSAFVYLWWFLIIKSSHDLILFFSKDGKPTQEILDMLYDADLNKDKSVSFEEFKNMLCNPKNNLNKNEASFMVKLLRRTINSGKSQNLTIKKGLYRVHNTIVVHSLPKGPIQVSMIFSCS